MIRELICKLFGHKWKWMGRAGMTEYGPDYSDGYLIYECLRCGISCRENEETGEEDMWW